MFYLVDIQPIEEAFYDFDDVKASEHASLTDVLHTFNKLMDIQAKIQHGEIQLKDQYESYKKDKAEFKRLMAEQEHQEDPMKYKTPAFDFMMKKYGEAVKT